MRSLFCLFLASFVFPTAFAQTCNLVYCTRFGQRAECEFQSQLFPCALWHSLETRVNPDLCDADCPLQCAPEDQRPIASDGNVYCTQCALRYASCKSRFVVFGPVNFGTPNDLPLAPVSVGVSPSPTPSSMAPVMEPTDNMSAPSVVTLPLPANISIGPVEMGMQTNTSVDLSREELEDFVLDESPMPSSPEDDPTVSPEQTALLCQRDLNIFERIQCCNQLDIGCVQAGQNCSTTGSLLPPVPCASGLECVIFDAGFPAADRPNRGICEPSDIAVASAEPSTEPSPDAEEAEEPEEPGEPEEPEEREAPEEPEERQELETEQPDSPTIPQRSNDLQQGDFCSTLGSLFPAATCASGLFCDIFDPGFPAADVPNRGICRPVGSTPLTARDDTPARMLPAECQGDLDNFARRACCVESGVRCLRRGELCSTAGSRIAPIPCADGLVCRIFDEGFPAVDRPNRGVCVPV